MASLIFHPKFFNEISTEKGENNIVKATAIYY